MSIKFASKQKNSKSVNISEDNYGNDNV